MTTRTKRIKMRADEESEAPTARAAALLRVSVSAFVLGVAGREVDRVLSEADQSVTPAAQFDELMASSTFICGNDVLDVWMREQGLRAERAGVSATTVWTPVGEQRVAYHSIAPKLLRRDRRPSRTMSGDFSEVAGFRLGQLALDQSLHRKRLGSQLLLDALELIVPARSMSTTTSSASGTPGGWS